MRAKCCLGSPNRRDHSEDLGVDGRIIKMNRWEMESEGVDCIDLAQDRDCLRALVNTVMYLRVP
jgi:hypothetical protein